MSGGQGQSGGSDYRGLALAGTAVTEMVAPILIGVWAQDRYGFAPWGLVGGAVLGVVGGIGHLFWMARRVGDSNGTQRNPRGPFDR